MNVEGCKMLINAVYEQAARDYITAVINNDKETQKEIMCFFSYTEKGKYIQRKCLEEIKICKKFISSFLESDSKKIPVDGKLISIPVLAIVKNSPCYNDKVKLEILYKDGNKGNGCLRKKMKPLTE